jgi:hypothetical protein
MVRVIADRVGLLSCHSFTREELSTRPDLIRQLVPEWCEPELEARGVKLEGFGLLVASSSLPRCPYSSFSLTDAVP